MYVEKDCCNFFLLQLTQILRSNLNKRFKQYVLQNNIKQSLQNEDSEMSMQGAFL